MLRSLALVNTDDPGTFVQVVVLDTPTRGSPLAQAVSPHPTVIFKAEITVTALLCH